MNIAIKKTLLTLVTSSALVLLMALAPSMVIAEEGGGSSGGGGGEGSSGGSGSSGGGANGGYHGAEMTRLMTIARFSLVHNYPSLLSRTKPLPKKISDEEQRFLCGMNSIRVNRPDRLGAWFPAFLATLLGRSTEEIRLALKSPTCTQR